MKPGGEEGSLCSTTTRILLCEQSKFSSWHSVDNGAGGKCCDHDYNCESVGERRLDVSSLSDYRWGHYIVGRKFDLCVVLKIKYGT